MSDTINIPRTITTLTLGDGREVESEMGVGYRVRTVSYEGDELKVWGKNLGFMAEPAFQRAYRRGMDSGHRIMRGDDPNLDLHVEYRVHVLISAAKMGSRLEGDFVECGVNTGIYSLAICDYLDFNTLDKKFYLFDTFQGVPVDQAAPGEVELLERHRQYYFDCFEQTKANFAPYPKAQLIQGKVPETLAGAGVGKVCYLSIDMNLALPERAAIEFFWDKLSVGAPVVLDDYAWVGYEPQKATMDEFAASKGTAIMTLPTGQGLLIKT